MQSDLERKLRIRTENLFASGIMNLLSDTAPAGINHYHLLLFFLIFFCLPRKNVFDVVFVQRVFLIVFLYLN